MDAGEARTRSIEEAALLFDRSNIAGSKDAIEAATASIVAGTVFLEQAVGTERTVAVLYAALAVVRNAPRKN
jgi:Rad3-related DNA helicase